MSLNDARGKESNNPPRRYKPPGSSRRARHLAQTGSGHERDGPHEVIRIDSSDGSASPPSSSSRQQRQHANRRRVQSNKRQDVPKQYLDLVREAVGAERRRKAAASAPPPQKRHKSTIPNDRMSISSFQRPPPAANISDEESAHSLIEISDHTATPPPPLLQSSTTEQDSAQDDDYDFEDVGWEQTAEPMGLEQDALPPATGSSSPQDSSRSPTTLDIDLSRPSLTTRRGVSSRHGGRKVTSVDRKFRIEVHKLHLMCLITHLYVRNKWLDRHDLLEQLKPLVTPGIRSLLFPSLEYNNAVRSRKFLDGLRQVMELWARRFSISKIGISKPHWGQKPDTKDMDPPMDYNAFKSAIRKKVGSRDIGAQGFCGLLRSIGLNVRLVASLQPLDFSFSRDNNDDDDDNDDENQQGNLKLRKPGESEYPIYWVEVWDTARKVWVVVDPMAIKTIEIPSTKSKLEPPSNDNDNTMAYVVGFKRDGSGKDVTRRYAKGFNAKTRKLRITQFSDGAEWYDNFMKLFQFPLKTEDSEAEDEYLTNRETNEPIPQNVQDFKGHPYFVLERHLRQDQVLAKKVPVGKLSTTRSISAQSTGEDIYRRKDVRTVKSSFGWYRGGRSIKPGEQPVKYSTKRRTGRKRVEDEDEDDGGSEELEDTGMYMESQTEVYKPPPVVDGIVPRNAYGNIDVYVPSMVPEGGVHLPYNTRVLIDASRLAGVDAVTAVSGFDYSGRGSLASPRYSGVVVAREYAQAVVLIYQGLIHLAEQEERDRRDRNAMKRWKRFLKGIQIRARLQREHGVGSESESDREIETSPQNEQDQDDISRNVENFHEPSAAESIEKSSTRLSTGTTLRELAQRQDQQPTAIPFFLRKTKQPTLHKDINDNVEGNKATVTVNDDDGGGGKTTERESNNEIVTPAGQNQSPSKSANSDGGADIDDENEDESDHYLDWI